MKKTYIIFSLILSLVFIITACDEDERLYKKADLNGDAAITFQIVDYTDNQNLPGDVGGEYNIEIYVSTLGRPVPSEVTIPITIDSTTFTDGVIISEDANVVIPAGSNVGHANLKVDLDELPLGVSFDIYYSLGTPSAYEFAYETTNGKLTVIRVCPTNLAGTYDMVATGFGGGGINSLGPWTSSLTEATIEQVGELDYEISPALGGIMVDYYAGYGATQVTAEFTDICGTLTGSVVDGWNRSAYNGTVNEATGVITFTWTNPWGDNIEMTLTPR